MRVFTYSTILSYPYQGDAPLPDAELRLWGYLTILPWMVAVVGLGLFDMLQLGYPPDPATALSPALPPSLPPSPPPPSPAQPPPPPGSPPVVPPFVAPDDLPPWVTLVSVLVVVGVLLAGTA